MSGAATLCGTCREAEGSIRLSCGHLLCPVCVSEAISIFVKSAEDGDALGACKLLRCHIAGCGGELPSEVFPPRLKWLIPFTALHYEGVKEKLREVGALPCECEPAPACARPGACSAVSGMRLLSAAAKHAFYLCLKCRKPYWGGSMECDEKAKREDGAAPAAKRAARGGGGGVGGGGGALPRAAPAASAERGEQMCGACFRAGLPADFRVCPTHGPENIAWKCCHCCSYATFLCRSQNYYCDA